MPEVLQQMLNYVIAIYIRLSAEDGDLSDEKSESNSVVNQRAYIRRFIELRPEFAGARILEFCDDGYSGTNMERPAVRRLLEQVRQRKINCIIVKHALTLFYQLQPDAQLALYGHYNTRHQFVITKFMVRSAVQTLAS